MAILVTGGAGYIGSHTVLALLSRGDEVVVLDNFVNASAQALNRVAQICGRQPHLYRGDVRDRALLRQIFAQHAISDVIHFAGLKAVGESVEKPLEYYDNNVSGTLVLLEEMHCAGVQGFIFSSSATVYGDPESVPLTENSRTGGTTNPYGTSKLMVEQILQDVSRARPEMRITALRYFNPVGAHPSGLIGEDPNGIPNNLVPYVAQVAVGKLACLSIFGDDYPTHDGTGVRDYIHVMDLATGHLAALDRRDEGASYKVYNLGTGVGYSVLDIVAAFERCSGVTIPYRFAPRRAGDIAECWSDPALAARELGWRAQYDLDQMMRDTWRWQQSNPNGYQD
ncbi:MULTISPECIES: UDP-glucose 4-epimerase GalE [Edwardsiella]|uniref:UDP-glucose 4-epimerase n=2 Tax=Edwardsiella anguillarum TaxID=1821960 RepID=A0A076LVM4_9GAMM|nr:MULTISPECIES: UDP-glucose 4-epimerase GalE [Edwardsiella]AKM48306.1 UDP-glucose 4-epimerase [Edwardsiella sp. EA181011]GAJ66482.1 UDP-glucose 4-epimerase [Edwardsiella piscicida]AIJ09574.1 UDP-glucose 4-epimerase [Edwardsiella anguillarum ET080813]AKR77338.1 UDP-glucose 4-epimerase GalE [Edwardsiella sp. LADL05-105]KAB0592552.1 UDP-glucose 4-epimerase GalE [Edwardsiella anguillarum]